MQRRSLDFAEFVNEEVLEQVPYRHVVTTVPKVLRRYFLRDRALLRELGHCVWKTLCR
ncbi:MAG: IS91 family transposase, partial [Armatimonadetes bacterium]|nr:IS91 family transposase [Armatimonadota bacterium]